MFLYDLGSNPYYLASVISAIFSGIASIIGAFNARKIEHQKEQILSVKKTGEATHKLTNGAMGAQLLVNQQLLQALADQATRFGDTAAARGYQIQADAAAKLYTEHTIKERYIVELEDWKK